MSPFSIELLEDVVILGRAAPEEMGDGRQTCCTGGWSEHRGFIRLYPIDPTTGLFSRWDVVNVEAKRNPEDTRDESWKLARRDQAGCVDVVDQVPRERRATILSNLEDRCVADLNERGRSLGIIRPEPINRLDFEEWEEDDDGTVQTSLVQNIEEWRPDNREEFEHQIRINYACSDCQRAQGYEDQQVLEWGGYVATARHDIQEPTRLEEFYNIGSEDYHHWLFVGNMAKHRTSYITISIIPVKRDVPIYDDPFTEYQKVSDTFVPLAERD